MANASELIDLLGGTCKVARLLRIRASSVSQWRARAIPEAPLIKLAARIERVSGGAITRRELFPEDWERIWPELSLLPVVRRVSVTPVTLH